MSQVFMIISVYRNFLFHARCGAMDFFDRLSTGTKVPLLSLIYLPKEKISGCFY